MKSIRDEIGSPLCSVHVILVWYLRSITDIDMFQWITSYSPLCGRIGLLCSLRDKQISETTHVNLKHAESEKVLMIAIQCLLKYCLDSTGNNTWTIWPAFLQFSNEEYAGLQSYIFYELADSNIRYINHNSKSVRSHHCECFPCTRLSISEDACIVAIQCRFYHWFNFREDFIWKFLANPTSLYNIQKQLETCINGK